MLCEDGTLLRRFKSNDLGWSEALAEPGRYMQVAAPRGRLGTSVAALRDDHQVLVWIGPGKASLCGSATRIWATGNLDHRTPGVLLAINEAGVPRRLDLPGPILALDVVLTEAARAHSGCAAAIVVIEAIGRWLLALADDGTVHVSRWTEPPSAAVVGAVRAQLDEALGGRRCRSLGCMSNGEALLLLLEDGEAIVVTLRPGYPQLRRIRGRVMDALHTDVGTLLRFEDGEYQWIHALRSDGVRFSCT
jgi:hypothetical protein